MKKIVILILFVAASCAVFGQSNTINQMDKNGLPFGKWIYYYSNGCVKEEGVYKIKKCRLRGIKGKAVRIKTPKHKVYSVRIGIWKCYAEDCKFIEQKDYGKRGRNTCIHT